MEWFLIPSGVAVFLCLKVILDALSRGFLDGRDDDYYGGQGSKDGDSNR